MASNQKQRGFALLVSLIVVGVVLSVGLVILDLSIKQVRLAATTKDSEIAFHAANAGLECARFWRRETTVVTDLFSSGAVTGNDMQGVTCFGDAFGDVSAVSNATIDSYSDAEQYQYEFSWPVGAADRCTRVNMVAMAVPITGTTLTITNSDMRTLMSGYPEGADVECEPGSQCTVIAVQGYNQACPAGDFGFGVVERQVLLEF